MPVWIYDNTSYEPELLLRLDRLAVVKTRLKQSQMQHFEIARSVAAGLGCDVRDLLPEER